MSDIKTVPCKRDCPNRTATCHGTCKRYADYVKANTAKRESILQAKYLSYQRITVFK